MKLVGVERKLRQGLHEFTIALSLFKY